MKARLGLLLTTYYSAWTGATVSPLPGSLSPIAPFRWLGKWWKIVMVMIRLSDGFQPERKLKPFACQKVMTGEPLPVNNLHHQYIKGA